MDSYGMQPDGDWISRSCTNISCMKGEKNKYHDHGTSTLLIEALDVSVADQRKTCVKTKAPALSFTLLAIALALGENPISGRKPVTSRFYKSKIYHEYTVHMSKTTNIFETS